MTTFVRVTSDLYPRRIHRNYAGYDNYLRENQGIDAAILAFNLGLSERFVMYRLRKTGLRKLTSPSDYRKTRRVT